MKIDGLKAFSFEELSTSTDGFSNSFQIGLGGYGNVYMGWGLLANGKVAAIKRAEQRSLQGSKEFLTEIELLSRLHHRNVISLLGYCNEKGEQILVYEYMPNGTLRDRLSLSASEPLKFRKRLQIALGASRGIKYLHTEADPPVYHGDIKSSNVLLDSESLAKVSDFGLSRCAPLSEREGSALGHVSTVAKGTPGYIDPEYICTNRLTDKCDVYSLGVVFLELLTGKTAVFHGKNLVSEVVTANNSGKIQELVDQRIGVVPWECLERFLALGLRCCHVRPSIADVVRELDTILEMTPETDDVPFESVAMDPTGTHVASSSAAGTWGSGSSMSSLDMSGSNLIIGAVPSINLCRDETVAWPSMAEVVGELEPDKDKDKLGLLPPSSILSADVRPKLRRSSESNVHFISARSSFDVTFER